MRPNPFENVDTASISNAINNFVNSLSEVNYNFTMSTKAKYDEKFNNGIRALKNEDIADMIALCSSCNSKIIAKINDYNNYYNTTYKPRYYNWLNAPSKITENNEKKDNPEKADLREILRKAEDYLDTLEKAINNASF